MKPVKQFIAAFLLFLFAGSMAGCGNKTAKPGKAAGTDSTGMITDTLAVTQNPGSTGTTNADPGTGNEAADIPVYAVWVAKELQNRTYDGLYDSLSGYFRLCENKTLYHINDLSEISLNPDNKCYNENMVFKMVVIQRTGQQPLFVTVLHVDSLSHSLVGFTDHNDTIATSVKAMKPEAFERLKAAYRVNTFKEVEINNIKKYYRPEMKVQNLQKIKRF